jgi:hypothetical protein
MRPHSDAADRLTFDGDGIMEIKTETFGTLTQAAFDKSCRYLKSVGTRIAVEFEAVVTFGVAAVFSTGDATHINKVLPLLRIAKLEAMFRRTVVAFEIVPFHYDKAECQFIGKINKGRCAALKIVDTNGVPQWEGLLKAALDGEKPENKAPKAFNLESRMDSLFKAARKEGATDAEITAAYRSAKRKHPADSTMLTAKDQVRVEENKARLDGEVKKEIAARKAA